jgi:PTH1 family peptidyl-tRNA hydrolase
VGLGNPGETYARSRHNAGFLVLDRCQAEEAFSAPRRKFQVKYSETKLHGEQVYLLEPQTYMNRSGPAVREFLGYFGREDLLPRMPHLSDSVLVVHDDLDLEMGRLRFRARGSSGGHRGVDSIIEALATDEVSRLKIGIGRREGVEAKDYVLERMGGEEEKSFLEVCTLAAETLPHWIREGTGACANRYNRADFKTG